MRRRSSMAMVAGVLCAHGTCLAGVTYFYEDFNREVEASQVGIMTDTYDWRWATDLLPFSVDVNGTAAEYRMMQQSRLDPTAISFQGEVMGGSGPRIGGWWHRASSLSTINILFEVDVATPYDVMVSASGQGDWSLESWLVSVPGDVQLFSGAGVGSGVLAPGQYRFHASIWATGLSWFDPDSGFEMQAPSNASISAVLNIPAPMAAPVLGFMVLAGRRRR